MRPVEKLCLALRHSKYLDHANWAWDTMRPVYDRVISLAGRKGLERVINGTDPILVTPKSRSVTECYEPNVWRSLMNELRPGDTFVDVGVFIGLYTVATAKRVGATGRVVGFEPDPTNYLAAIDHVRLNGLDDRVALIPAAVGAAEERVPFKPGGDMAHVVTRASENTCTVRCVTLDLVFPETQVDVLKIDVEGFEEKVLQGAKNVLSDVTRCPRAIFIEVHPYAWPELGTTSGSLLGCLDSCGYQTQTLDGRYVEVVAEYGEIVARKKRNQNSNMQLKRLEPKGMWK